MRAIRADYIDFPEWRPDSERRLLLCMLSAALFLAVLLPQLRIPLVGDIGPLSQVLVRILPAVQEKPAEEAADVVPEIEPAVTDEFDPPAPPLQEQAVEQSIDVPAQAWDAIARRAVEAAVDDAERTISVYPALDERRSIAAEQFRPSEAPEKREIWDNVEKDQAGRTVLRNGDCFRVLDDPTPIPVLRWGFEQFGQYIVYCEFVKRPPKNLPWVAEVRSRYSYLGDD